MYRQRQRPFPFLKRYERWTSHKRRLGRPCVRVSVTSEMRSGRGTRLVAGLSRTGLTWISQTRLQLRHVRLGILTLVSTIEVVVMTGECRGSKWTARRKEPGADAVTPMN